MMLFDIKVRRCECSDGKVYIEFIPSNEELKDIIYNGGTYEVINNSVQDTISSVKNIVREEMYNLLPEDIKILYVNNQFKINNSIEDPTNIDYDVYGFQKKRTILFGELREIEYYKNYISSSQTYSDLVVKEYRDYTRDANGLVQFRTQTSVWYLNDNNTGITKSSIKYYTLPEAIQEGLDRRGNIIAQAKAYALANIGQLYSFDLLASVKNEIQLFVDGYTQPLRNAVSASTKPYISTTIKENLIENLRLE